MSSFRELQDATYFWLGTTDRNAAFPREQIKRIVNEAQESLYEDAVQEFPDRFRLGATLLPDMNDPTAYVLGAQTPPITGVQKIVDLRVTDYDGIPLVELPISERHYWGRANYGVLGVESLTLVTSGSGYGQLYLEYVPTIPPLVGDSDTPGWMPTRFHDVIGLEAAFTAVGTGNEQALSPNLIQRWTDRRAQWLLSVGQISLDVTRQRQR